MTDDLNAKLWQQFINALTTQGGMQADPRTFLPTNGMALADWQVMDSTGLPPGNPNAKNGDIIVSNMETWADTMPVYSPTYQPGDSFYDNYSAFLNAIQIPGGNPAQQQIADGMAVTLKKQRDKLQADKLQMFKDWATFNSAQAGVPPSAQTSYSDWYNQEYASTISTDASNVAAANTDYLKALQAVGGPDFATISSALSKLQLNPAAGNGITDPTTGLISPAYAIEGGLNDWYLAALQSAGLGHSPAIDFTIDLSQAEGESNEASSYIGGSASGGYDSFFWGGSASASFEAGSDFSDLSQLAKELTMRYTAQALGIFTVRPGAWYDSAMIKGFFDKISPNSAFANKPLFGAGGLLSLRTAQIFVVYKRSVTLTGSSATMAQVSSAFSEQANGHISVGGMFWGGSASGSLSDQNSHATAAFSSDGTSVTIADNTNAPKVIGIVPQNLDPSA